MTEAVEEHPLAATGERIHDREVGHIAGGEEQRTLAMGESG